MESTQAKPFVATEESHFNGAVKTLKTDLEETTLSQSIINYAGEEFNRIRNGGMPNLVANDFGGLIKLFNGRLKEDYYKTIGLYVSGKSNSTTAAICPHTIKLPRRMTEAEVDAFSELSNEETKTAQWFKNKGWHWECHALLPGDPALNGYAVVVSIFSRV